jgi:hypothetical protein
VFFHGDEQKRLATASRDRLAKDASGTIRTAVLPATRFHLAEPYHQKYSLQLEGNLVREFRAMYPDNDDFINSTAATRVNSYLAGYGSEEVLRKELQTYGLSAKGVERLLAAARTSGVLPKTR